MNPLPIKPLSMWSLTIYSMSYNSKIKCFECVIKYNNNCLKTCSGLEPILRCEPSTYQSNDRWLSHCTTMACGKQEGNYVFNDALNTFYLRLYGITYMVKDYSDSERGNLLPHQGYFFQLAARVLLYAPFHRQDSTYHGLCYISCEALAGTFAKACHKMQILAMNLNKSHRINFSNMQIKMQKTFIIHDVVMYKLFYTQMNLNLSQTSVTYYSDTQ